MSGDSNEGNIMQLTYHNPADQWVEGFPIGNGRFGAMVCSTPSADVLYLNDDTLWSGYPHEEVSALNREAVDRAAELAERGQYAQAHIVLAECTKRQPDVQIYEPLGTLTITFDGESDADARGDAGESACGHEPAFTRSLDLNRAVASAEASNRTMTVFCSHPADLLVYRVESDRPFSCLISAHDGFLEHIDWDHDRGQSESDGIAYMLTGQCPGLNLGGMSGGVGRDHPWEPRERGVGMAYAAGGHITVAGATDGTGETDATIRATPEGLRCERITRLTLTMSTASGYRGRDEQPERSQNKVARELADRLQGMRIASYDDALACHIADYRALFDRVSIDLGGTESLPHGATAGDGAVADGDAVDVARLLASSDGNQRVLARLLFDFGRYLAIASSRPGSQPANLQGIWNHRPVPSWLCDYTTNINVEMNYWLTGPCDLHELIEPLVMMNRELLEPGERAARGIFHADGSAVFHNVDLWRKATPARGNPSWAFWPFGQAWMCRNLYDDYLFTLDRDYLREIWPIMVASARFVLSELRETPRGLAICPATSPENTFIDVNDGREVAVALYSENVQAIARNLLHDLVDAYAALEDDLADGIPSDGDREVIRRAKEALPRLVPARIGGDGRILEWDEPLVEADPRQRHLSHLYDLHPGTGIVRGTPELFDAARRSLLVRGLQGSGWSEIWRMIMWARLGDGERAGLEIREFSHAVDPSAAISVHGGGVYPSLLCAHPPFQIDGNLGFPAAICEMLLQSHDGTIRILPAVPRSWSVGKASGLKARGNIRVDLDWNDHEVRCRLQAGRRTAVRIAVGDGEPREVTIDGAFDVVLSRQLLA